MKSKSGKKKQSQITHSNVCDRTILNYQNMSEERLIHIYEEAYYRALNKIQEEKRQTKEVVVKDLKWYENILYFLNIIIFPFHINKHFVIRDKIYDSVLIMFVSWMFMFVGFLLWSVGICGVVFFAYSMITSADLDFLLFIAIAFLCIMFGSLFIVSGKEFSSENKSETIYAYSACFFALVSCIIGMIALVKQLM